MKTRLACSFRRSLLALPLATVSLTMACGGASSEDDGPPPVIATNDLSSRAGHREVEIVTAGLPRGLAMRIDDHGTLHAAFVQNQGSRDRVVYATRPIDPANGAPGAGFNLEEVTFGSPYLEGTGIALDADGEPFIAFFDRGTIKLAHRAGPRVGTTSSSWQVETVEENVGASLINPTPRVEIAHDGTLHVTYNAFATPPNEPNTSRGCVKHAVRSPASAPPAPSANGSTTAPAVTSAFTTEIVDCGEVYEPGWVAGSAGIASLALDANGAPHLCYGQSRSIPGIRSNDDLKYAQKPIGAAKFVIETVAKGGHRGGSCSIAIDAQGRPSIADLDWATYDARFARKDGSAWTSSMIESNGSVGRFSNVMLGGGGTHVSYIDEASGALRLASSTPGNAAWEIEDVSNDAHAFAGGDMVSALDSHGEAHFLLTRIQNNVSALVYVH